ncbi:LysR substrate-binding domain-containing protein [Reyranella sp.]|uniref:LysR substrate-binding domain-containing protein n=1 Tax=Reyranella sp. TaxID=1929291 RepID=UPI003BABDDFC
MRQSRLPLRGIAVFATVARLGSLKAAASELNLSPSAVSHAIRALEEELGVELFKRVSRGVRLTPDAARYAEILQGLFERMRRATADIAAPGWSRASAGVVRIMTPPSLATHWLMPRLPAFIKAHPGVDLRVFAVRTADGNAEDFDITIGYGDAARWRGRARPLLEERTQPYCAPSRLQGVRSLTARQLLAHPLIQSRENAVSWEAWLGRRGIALDASKMHLLQIDPSYVAIEAAVNGVGIILESSILTREHVEAGRLVVAVPETRPASIAYWLLPLHEGARPSVVKAYKWLIDQANFADACPSRPATRATSTRGRSGRIRSSPTSA